jgi:hypothetical protein
MRKPNNRYVKELVYKLMAHAPRTVIALCRDHAGEERQNGVADLGRHLFFSRTPQMFYQMGLRRSHESMQVFSRLRGFASY